LLMMVLDHLDSLFRCVLSPGWAAAGTPCAVREGGPDFGGKRGHTPRRRRQKSRGRGRRLLNRLTRTMSSSSALSKLLRMARIKITPNHVRSPRT
jgi:hypothetical protein